MNFQISHLSNGRGQRYWIRQNWVCLNSFLHHVDDLGQVIFLSWFPFQSPLSCIIYVDHLQQLSWWHLFTDTQVYLQPRFPFWAMKQLHTEHVSLLKYPTEKNLSAFQTDLLPLPTYPMSWQYCVLCSVFFGVSAA